MQAVGFLLGGFFALSIVVFGVAAHFENGEEDGERGLRMEMDFPNILCLCRMRGSYIRLIGSSQSGSNVG